ncbi:hypothetical protein BY458DRAFT_474834 [Sporodiniella umbellata]|nr:hypothetical protein BY458DRAFT_474834 [Sporodiniella umbellata]
MSSGTQSIADFTTETKPTHGDIPPPLVGATVTSVGEKLYLFGGRLTSSRQMTNNLYILDLVSLCWTRHIAEPDSPPPPQPRYFHSTNLYGKHLFVCGGMGYLTKRSSQSLCALDDVCLFNLELMTWEYPEIPPSIYKPQARYAHLSVISQDKLVIIGGQNMANQYIDETNVFCLSTFQWILGGALNKQYGAYRSIAFCPSEYSNFWDREKAVCVYSNYNFADVTRELQSFALPTSNTQDHSASMTGLSLPPGLRFPCGFVLGNHLILSGTYLTPTLKAFNIWALNLTNLVWVRIDVGSALSQGSWNKGVLCEENGQFVVFGDKTRDLLEDYSHRQVNYTHVSTIHLEAFGIYTIPEETSTPVAQELGLSMLKTRWPYFSKLLLEKDSSASGFKKLVISEGHPVALAFVQYLYTDHLITAQQHHPNILSRLLFLSDMYGLKRLNMLVVHALHEALTISTASMIYEVSALTGQMALQIRALRVMINAKKMMQQEKMLTPNSPLTESPSLFATHYSTTNLPSPTMQKVSGPLSPTLPKDPRWMTTSKSLTAGSSSIYTKPVPKVSKSSTLYHASQKTPSGVVERPRKASLTYSGMMSPTLEPSDSMPRF